MAMAKTQLHSLKEDMVNPFPGVEITILDIEWTIYEDFVHFVYEVLEPTMRKSANELLATGASIPHVSTSLLPAMIA
jgi:hypothetical protein